MVHVTIVLYLIAAILFAVAFFGVGSRYNLMAGGLFFWVLTFLVGKIDT